MADARLHDAAQEGPMATLKRFGSTALVAALALACASEGPTGVREVLGPQLITNGEPTGDLFGSVGALLFDFDGDGKIHGEEAFCSGSLVADTVFLTAAHCLAFFPPDADLFVTFDPDLLDHLSKVRPLIPATGFAAHPAYTSLPFGTGVTPDIGVVLLPRNSTKRIAPVQLPPEGYLTELKASGDLHGQLFVNVGYGVSAEPTGPPRFSSDGKRKSSLSLFMALQPQWLGLLMNENATGEGGDCFGDSGSPKFLEGNPDLIVAIVVWGDVVCRATSWDYRLDTPEARAFLANYVTLP
jgi:hypothetical protein